MAVLLSDTFDRANSTNVPGSPQVGGPYTVRAGTWGITTNLLYTSASLANAIITAPAARDVDFSYTENDMTNSSGMIFRYTDLNNFWLLYQPTGNGATWTLSRRINNVNFTWYYQANLEALPGDVVRIKAYGTHFSVYINGVFQIIMDDPWYASTPLNAAVGFWINSDTRGHIDNALAVDATTALPYDAIPAASPPLDVVAVPDPGFNTGWAYRGRDTKILDLGAVV